MASWRSMFAPQILARAREYYRRGKAKRLVREEDDEDVFKIKYTATVRGSRNYSVEIDEYDGAVEEMSCTCPYAQSGGNCKHEAAVLYAIEDEYYKLEAEDDEEDSEDGRQRSGEAGSVRTDNVMTDRPAAGGRKDEKDEIIYPASLPALDALQKEEAEHRRELAGVDPYAESGQSGDYRYFHPENFEKGLKITAEAEKQAQKVLEAEKKPKPETRSLGYYMRGEAPLEDFQVRIGFPDGDGSEPMHGEATAVLGDSYYGSRVRIVFDQDHIVHANCNNWNCRHRLDESEIGHVLCGHEVALIRKTEAYLSANNVGDATSMSGMIFLGEMLPLAAERKDAAEGSGENPEENQPENGTRILTLAPHVELRDGNLSASFYVGSSKLYKLRDLNAFVSAVQRQEPMEFGKSTVLPMGRQYLKDERSTAWYEFIRDALQEKKQRDQYYGSVDRNYLPGDTIKADLPLFGHTLDEFARLAEGAPFEYWDKAYVAKLGKKLLSVRDVMSAIRLEVHAAVSGGNFSGAAESAGNQASAGAGGAFDGVRITGDAPEFIKGQDRLYYVEGSWFNRIGPEDSKRIAPLVNVADGGKIDIRVGRSHLSDFYHKVLPQLRQMAEVTEYDTDLISRYIPPEPVFTAYFDTENQSILCRLETSYGQQVFSTTDVFEAYHQNEHLKPAYRDEEREAVYLETALHYIPTYDQRLHILFCQKNDEQVFDLLDHGLAELGSMGEVRMTQRFRALGIRRHVKFSMGVSIESNLMDLTVASDDLTEDEMYEILYQYQRKRRFVRLKDGTFFKLENNGTLENLVQIMETMQVPLKEFVKGKMHLPAYRALYLDRMLEGTEDLYASRDRRFKELVKEFKTVEDADFEVPARLQKILRNYQKDGYRWLRTLDRYGFGGILADEMGLGKTVQVIAVILAAKLEESPLPEQTVSRTQQSESESAQPAGPKNVPAAAGQSSRVSLVVCPASLVYNWEEEFHRFAPELSVTVIAGTAAERHEQLAALRSGKENCDVLVTSYDLLKRDIAEYEGLPFRYEIIDEGQFIKNARTAAAKSVKLIHAKTRFALTGTPIENRLSELWSIFDYLMPGFLYDYAQFQTTFENPIGRESEAAAERLRKMVAPFILRRRKEDVLKDLPEKLEEVRYVALEGKQLQLYDAQVMKMKADLKDQSDVDFRKGKIEILAELTRIRQLCCDPELVYANYDGTSAKREALLDMIRTLLDEGHRALIFSQFTSMLELVSQDLDREKISYYTITGATPKAKRMELVRAFNAGEGNSADRISDGSGSGTDIFLISLKAGGTGLNLTGADVVIHYDPWWNTAAEDQATDRAHRIGQKKVVTVYRLIARGTIEDRIMEMQSRKKDLADQVLGGEDIGSSRLTKEDLLEILE